MATEKQLNEVRVSIRELIKKLLETPIDQWATRPTLGDINFAGALPVIGRVRQLLSMIAGFNLDYVSYAKLKTLQNALQQIEAAFERVNNFNLSIPNPSAERNQIITDTENQYDSWFEAMSPIVTFAIRSTTDFEALERDLRSKISDAEKQSTELLEGQKRQAAEAEATLSAIKKAAAEAGVSQEAVYFKEQADEHMLAARWWLMATIALAVATAAWGAVALWFIPIHHGADNAEIVHQAVAKIIIFTGLYYALIWCARNFTASRHNYVVNRHRQNSLSTFESFVKAAEQDNAIKNAVLLQATTSIFNSQPSGYGGSKDSDSEPPNKIIEIIRSISDKPK